MKLTHKNKNRGATLVEMLVYVIIFSVLSVVVFNAILSMTRSFQSVAIDTELMKASSVMERITREARRAVSINSFASSDITLDTTDEAGNPTTVRFVLNGNNVDLYKGGVLAGELNSENIAISSLTFTAVGTGAIRVSYVAQSILYGATKSEPYQSTVVLRGAY